MKKIFLLLFITASLHGYSQLSTQEILEYQYITSFRQTTVSIGYDTIKQVYTPEGKIERKRIFSVLGTGIVFYVHLKDSGIALGVITAKHVLEGRKKVNIRLSAFDTLAIDKYFGIEVPLVLKDSSTIVTFHPNKTIDLACFPINILDSTLPSPFLTYGMFPEDYEYYDGREVFTLGYPQSVGEFLMNKAILRRGIISWVPPKLKQSSENILIDCNIFPGNSGGPVFSISREVFYENKKPYLKQPKFFGIVIQRRFSSNVLVNEKNVEIKDSIGNKIYSSESMGVGIIIPAYRVKELIDFVQKGINEGEIK